MRGAACRCNPQRSRRMHGQWWNPSWRQTGRMFTASRPFFRPRQADAEACRFHGRRKNRSLEGDAIVLCGGGLQQIVRRSQSASSPNLARQSSTPRCASHGPFGRFSRSRALALHVRASHCSLEWRSDRVPLYHIDHLLYSYCTHETCMSVCGRIDNHIDYDAGNAERRLFFDRLIN